MLPATGRMVRLMRCPALFGGMGGRPGADGLSAVSFPYNVRDVSIEWSEHETPILYHARELIPDRAAWRVAGRLGQELIFEAYEPGTTGAQQPLVFAGRGRCASRRRAGGGKPGRSPKSRATAEYRAFKFARVPVRGRSGAPEITGRWRSRRRRTRCGGDRPRSEGGYITEEARNATTAARPRRRVNWGVSAMVDYLGYRAKMGVTALDQYGGAAGIRRHAPARRDQSLGRMHIENIPTTDDNSFDKSIQPIDGTDGAVERVMTWS